MCSFGQSRKIRIKGIKMIECIDRTQQNIEGLVSIFLFISAWIKFSAESFSSHGSPSKYLPAIACLLRVPANSSPWQLVMAAILPSLVIPNQSAAGLSSLFPPINGNGKTRSLLPRSNDYTLRRDSQPG